MSQQYRWSGLAGTAGSLLFLIIFAFVGLVVGSDTSIDGFPGLRPGRTLENALYLAVLVLWIAPFLALDRALSNARPALARYASVVAVVGLGVLAAGALPHAASVALSDAYHLATATDVERAALAATWAGNQATMTMLLVTGLAIVPVGVVGLGAAMLRSPAFGRAIGWSTVGLGGVGAVVAVVLLLDPGSPTAALGFFALIAFQLVAGWRLYALSRSQRAATEWAAATGRSAG
jgi:hypothetical protein